MKPSDVIEGSSKIYIMNSLLSLLATGHASDQAVLIAMLLEACPIKQSRILSIFDAHLAEHHSSREIDIADTTPTLGLRLTYQRLASTDADAEILERSEAAR